MKKFITALLLFVSLPPYGAPMEIIINPYEGLENINPNDILVFSYENGPPSPMEVIEADQDDYGPAPYEEKQCETVYIVTPGPFSPIWPL